VVNRSTKELAMTHKTILTFTCALLSGFGSQALAQSNPLRDAYFAETHVHTSWSADAWLFGNRVIGPADAYKYCTGETIKHSLGYDIKIDTPLDFAGVTDHSEYVGVIKLANDPSSPVSKIPAAQPLILENSSTAAANEVFLYALNHVMRGPPVKALMSPEIAETVWQENVEYANQANEPGQVHCLLRLRADVHAQQHEPPPQHLLQGSRACAGDTVQLARFIPERG
jgi:hypothetical protein